MTYPSSILQSIGEALKTNKTLKCLNLESNYISGEGIKAVLEGAKEPQTLQELRVANQVSALTAHYL